MEQVVRCPSCGQANGIPDIESGKKAVCGKCKAPLTAGHPVELTDANFAETIRSGRRRRLLGGVVRAVPDDRAGHRGDWRRRAPTSASRKLNVDQNPRTAQPSFGVQGIPLLVFFKDGVEAGRVVGAVPRGADRSGDPPVPRLDDRWPSTHGNRAANAISSSSRRRSRIVIGVRACCSLLLWAVRDVLMLVFIAAVLAAGISPAVHRVRVSGAIAFTASIQPRHGGR